MHHGHRFAMLLRKAYLSFHRRANSMMLGLGVTADQFVLLDVVANNAGITQVGIAERTASDANTVAAVLKLLEKRGLVRREPHARDRRARCVFLTEQGTQVLDDVTETASVFLTELVACLPSEERSIFEQSLQRIHSEFSKSSDAANGRTTARSEENDARAKSAG